MEGRRRHVWPATVDAQAFESDAGRSTDATHLLNDAVLHCLMQNDPTGLEKLLNILHARWSLATPAATPRVGVFLSSEDDTGNSSETAWQTDCDALLALFYFAFVGGFVAEQVVELHLTLFLVKWFQCTESLLQVAVSVDSSHRTNSFMTMTLLYCCLQRRHQLPTVDVQLFLEVLEKDGRDAPQPLLHAPLWLQQIVGSSTPYPELITTLQSWVIFAYNIPTFGSDTSSSHVEHCNEFSSLLHITLHYQRETVVEEDSKLCKRPTVLQDCATSSLPTIKDNTLKACLFWLNGLTAAHTNKLRLASAEYRTAMETSVDCSAVLYNAYVAFSRRGLHDASIECLQLLQRVCQSPSATASCLPFTAALLAPLLPKPCQRGVTALLAGVCLRRQKAKEASKLLSSLLADPALHDNSGPVVPLHYRLLLLPRDRPPSCPSRSLLHAQAAVAAARLNEKALLEQLLEAYEENVSAEETRWRRFYNSDGASQTLTLSAILCALLRVSKRIDEGRSSEALTGAARLLEATIWISPAPNCPDRTPSLLLVTAMLCKAFLLSILCHLHTGLGNDTNARHFKRLTRQALASVKNIAAVRLKTSKTENKPNVRVCFDDRLTLEEPLADELEDPRLVERKNVFDEAVNSESLFTVVHAYCNSLSLSSYLDETCSIFLQNIAIFLSEQPEMI